MLCREIEKDDINLENLLRDCHGFSDEHFSQIYKFIISNPERTVFIIDGLDELYLHSDCLETDGSLHPKAIMPAFTWICMLVEGKLQLGATVLITS